MPSVPAGGAGGGWEAHASVMLSATAAHGPEILYDMISDTIRLFRRERLVDAWTRLYPIFW
jgi:hypothetical protein